MLVGLVGQPDKWAGNTLGVASFQRASCFLRCLLSFFCVKKNSDQLFHNGDADVQPLSQSSLSQPPGRSYDFLVPTETHHGGHWLFPEPRVGGAGGCVVPGVGSNRNGRGLSS